MDYCPGGELYMLLRAKKRLTVGETQFYGASVLNGLEALHMANIVIGLTSTLDHTGSVHLYARVQH